MKSAAYWSFRAAAELGDNEPDEGPSHCPQCGIWYAEVGEDGVMKWEDEHVVVNPLTGCLCAPEDYTRGTYTAADLNGMPF